MKAFLKLETALQQMRTKNGRAYCYYLARSKRADRGKQYMRVVNKLFVK
ncbi:hypothetical protein SAMN05660862_2278 [Sphingobacterium psychroaquaticum]|uniref:Uncharacterized protein n=1 Tax=Sphingobacterium psychroaquaticum TaxID=561061 RepID=A0A1X7JY17_9SPHI|nr:hypothetical protein SAMN05660862_2278 [Sphingobacterium psychroaquaticum]